MALQILKSNLISRTIREEATGGNILRRLNLTNRLASNDGGQGGGLLRRVLNFGQQALGFISNVIGGITITASAVFEWLYNRVEALKMFNWNATDEQLQILQRGQNQAVAAIWGGTIGRSIGYLVGIGVGAGVAFLCPVIGGAGLAKLVATNAGAEALGELKNGLLAALRQTAASFATNTLISGYMNYRRFLKNLPLGVLSRVYGEQTARFIRDQWGNEGGPDLSFNTQMEEAVERINNDTVRIFVENLLEESWDAFAETGFIVAQEIDNALQQSKQAVAEQDGPSRVVGIVPDLEAPEEVIPLFGREQGVKTAIQTSIATHRLLYNRDVGAIVGQPAEDWYRARPQRRKLTIVFRDKKSPPWRQNDGGRCKEATYTVPDCHLGLTWQRIKVAARAYTWGKYRTTAKLDNGRQMAVYGATPQEAQRKLYELLSLSTAEVISLSTSEEVLRDIRRVKRPTTMYPVSATLLIRRPSIELDGRTMLDGDTYREEFRRISLWQDTEPANMEPLN